MEVRQKGGLGNWLRGQLRNIAPFLTLICLFGFFAAASPSFATLDNLGNILTQVSVTIVIFLPGEFCGIKTVFMARQPDAIEALTPSSARRIHYQEVCALAGKDFAVALHLARQLAADERQLHNWNVRLGQANAEERVAALLLELRSRLLGLGVDAQERYTLPLTQQQIADHVAGPLDLEFDRHLGFDRRAGRSSKGLDVTDGIAPEHQAREHDDRRQTDQTFLEHEHD